MSFSDILQKVRNLLSFSTKENHLKRRAEQPPNYLGFTKYRKVNSYFPKNINKPFEDHMGLAHSTFSDELTMSQRASENNSFTRKLHTSVAKVPAFTDYEFSDDEDEIFVPQIKRQNSRTNSSMINSNYNRRPVLSEDNYEKNPLVYNIPIQIERKSKPPPLRDVRTGDLLAATCIPPTYSLKKFNSIEDDSTIKIKDLTKNHQMTEKSMLGNTNKISSSKHQNSLLAKSFNLQEKEGYLQLLSKLVPKLYKTETKENQRKRVVKLPQKREIIVDEIDLTNTKPTRKIETVINLIDEDENQLEELVNLTDEDVQVISAYEIYAQNRFGNKDKELPYIEPVNTLRQKLNLQPKLQTNWLNNFKGKYTEKNILRNKEILEEEENVKKLTKETAKQEKLLQERLRNVVLETEPILLDDSEAEEEVEFPEFSKGDAELIKSAIYKGAPDEILISKFNINITRRDINTLVGDNWLNDEVINFYMNLLIERGEQRCVDGYPKVYAMNTFFIPRLTQSGYSGVRRWTRKIDIFSYDVIPVPVHVAGIHWCMAIIHLKNKTIKYYDSMGQPNPEVLSVLEQYLKDEAFDKKKISLDNFTKESVMCVPRQMNGSDCGVFSCMFAEYITRNKDITFTQQHMHYFRQKMILEIVKGKLLL